MHTVAWIAGLLCCCGAVLDAFQTIILPRRPKGRFRITPFFYGATWRPWRWAARQLKSSRAREQMLGVFAPLSLLLLLVVWAVLLTVGFALILFGMGTPFHDTGAPASASVVWSQLRTDGYVSGTTLTTLGPGDVAPLRYAARWLMIVESGTGLGFVALVIAYIPVLYSTFSRRELTVALLDGQAGSPPTAAELLRRHAYDGGQPLLIKLLAEWERWSAELLETHVSYPILCYYRSQHDNQSWLSALTAVLDTCSLLIATTLGPEGKAAARQAQLTFTVARHALIDLGHVFRLEPFEQAWVARGDTDRLSAETYRRLCATVAEAEIYLCGDESAAKRLLELRMMYEPSALALGDLLEFSLPQWVAEPRRTDPWQRISCLRAQPDAVWARTRQLSEDSVAAHMGHDRH